MDLLKLFREYLSSQKSPSSSLTIKNYSADISHFISWWENEKKISFNPIAVTYNDISAFKSFKSNNLSGKSLDRHISSLRNFFSFLNTTGLIEKNPFNEIEKEVKEEIDPFALNSFKNHLYSQKASHLTIKNYIIDLKQFFSWVKQITNINKAGQAAEFSFLEDKYLEEYKNRLLREKIFSLSSINRKLSSIRKYREWAITQGFVKPTLDLENIEAKQISPEEINKQVENLSAKDFKKQFSYSWFAPLRVAQKIARGLSFLADILLISALAKLTFKIEGLFRKLDNKHVFSNKLDEAVQNQLVSTGMVGKIKKGLTNLYSPLSGAPEDLLGYHKFLYNAKTNIVKWYKKYRSYSITYYFHLSILVIFMSAIGFALYIRLFGEPGKQPVLAALPTAPPRILSFQARLTDSSDNPITARTDLRFAIYNDSSATGSALLWQENLSVTPDTDGIFSTLLGNNTTIPQSLFAQNSSLWLGVTVTTTPELTPRQQLATVAFATNAETLQGLPPITQAGAGTTNVVLALDSSGNLSIGGSASPTFQATGGQLTLAGTILSLTTTAGSNSNVQIKPDGTGLIDLQKPLTNSTLNNNIASAVGAVEVDNRFAILATSSGQSAFTLEQDSTGPLISASVSGIAKFTLGNSGSITAVNYAGANAVLYGAPTTGLFTTATTTTGSQCLTSQTGASGVPVWGSCGSGTNFWQHTTDGTSSYQLVSPATITDTLSLGVTASGTNLLHYSSVYIEPPQNTKGNAMVAFNQTGSGPIFTASVSGNTKFVIDNAGNVGIGTTLPTSLLHVLGTAAGAGTGASATQVLNIVGGNGGTGTAGGNGGTGGNGAKAAITAGNGGTGGNGSGPGGGGTGGNGANIELNSGIGGDGGVRGGTGTTGGSGGNAGNILLTALNGGNGQNGAGVNGVGGNGGNGGNLYFTPGLGGTAGTGTLSNGTPGSAGNVLLAVTQGGSAIGSVGIGTISPLTATGLDIEANSKGNSALVVANTGGLGDVFTASSGATTKFTIGSTGSITAINYAGANAVLYGAPTTGLFTTATTTTGSQCLLSAAGSSGTPSWGACSAGTNFWQHTTDGTSTYQLLSPVTISDTFSLGVTASGTNLLHYSSAYIEPPQNTKGNAMVAFNQTGSGPIFTASQAGTTKFVIDNAGNVGVGTSTPTSLFHIIGPNGAVLNNATQVLNIVGGTGGNGSNAVPQGKTGATAALTTGNGGNGVSGNSGNGGGGGLGGTLTLTSGNGGTGGAGSSVSDGWGGNGGDLVLLAGTGGTGGNSIGSGNGGNGGNLYLAGGGAGAGGSGVAGNTGNVILGRTSGGANQGNVGIGTSTTLAELDVRANIGTVPIASLSGKTSFAGLVVDNSGKGDLFTASSSGLPRFTITQNGNITDTTASTVNFSGAALTVASCTGCGGGGGTWTTFTNNANTIIDPSPITDALSIGNAGTGNYLPFSSFYVEPSFNSKGNALVGINQTGAGPIFTASVSGSTKFVIDNAGNVGIGTANPSSFALQVAGTIGANTTDTYNLGSATSEWLNTYSDFGNFDSGIQVGTNTLTIGTGTTPIATISGKTSFASLVVNNDGVGDLFTASSSSIPVFRLQGNGNITDANYAGANAVLYAAPTTGLFTTATTTTGSQCLLSVAGTSAPAWGSCGSGTNFWAHTTNNSNQVLSPVTLTDELSIGVDGTSSNFVPFSSVYVQPSINSKGNALVALNQTGGGPIFTASQAGSTKFTIDNSGNVAINGSSITTTTGTFNLLNTTATTINFGGGATTAINLGNSSGITNISGKLGIGTSAPADALDVRAINGTTAVASLSGQTSFAALIVNNDGVGDLIAASASSQPHFTVNNAGLITTTSVGTGSLKTATGSIVGAANSAVDAPMNDYNFFPSVTCNAGCNPGMQASPTTDPNNTIGRFHVNAPASGTVTVRWRYITASDHPTIWLVANSDGTIPGPVWEAEDPVSQINYPANPNPLEGNALKQGQTFLNPQPPSISELKNLYSRIPQDAAASSFAKLEEYIVTKRHWLNTFTSLDDLANISERYQLSGRQWALRSVTDHFNTAPSLGITLFFHIENGALVTNPDPYAALQEYNTKLAAQHAQDAAIPASQKQADIAEWYKQTHGDLQPGDVVEVDKIGGMIKTTKAYDEKVVGIVSTSPNQILGEKQNTNDIALALNGRVPVKASTENGTIQPGDYLTSSSTPGVAMKATKAGIVIGKALTGYDGSSGSVGSVMVLVTVGYNDPNIITNTGDLTIIPQTATNSATLSAQFNIQDTTGNIINKVEAFSQAVIANLRAGFINAESIATNQLSVATNNITIAGQSLDNYILTVVKNANLSLTNTNSITSPVAAIDTLHTNIISPLSKDAKIAVTLDNSKLSIHASNNASSDSVATIDNQGNASFSGQLSASNIQTNDATISGTLHAGKIIASEIIGLNSTQSAQYITNVTNVYQATPSSSLSPTPSVIIDQNASSIATGSSILATPSANVSQSLTSNFQTPTSYNSIASYSAYFSYVPHLNDAMYGATQQNSNTDVQAFNDAAVTGTLSVGGQLILANNTINVLGADLQLQPLRQGGVSIAGGQVYIDSNGDLTANGDATFKGNLAANIISPLATGDLNINLGGKDGNNTKANLQIKNASGSAIFTLNQFGDFVASGTATIAKLNLNPVSSAFAVSETEIVATSSAGTAHITPHQHEITIDNVNITENSLIYITPIGTPSGQTPFLLRQLPNKSFTIGIEQPSDRQTVFNWLIIN